MCGHGVQLAGGSRPFYEMHPATAAWQRWRYYFLMLILRLATEDDAAQVRAIYAPIVERTATSFEYDLPTIDEMRQRIAKVLPLFPWLVCERDGEVLGYAYAGRHKERAAYQWSADVSVYIHPSVHRKGVGRALYTSLFHLLDLQGLVNLYGGVTLPNPGSVGLHEAMGMRPFCVYKAIGYKFGAWHDVGWWHLALRERAPDPQPPLLLADARASGAWDTAPWQAALAAGLPSLRL
jgi:L-amino acid N-acyltransferase YncA